MSPGPLNEAQPLYIYGSYSKTIYVLNIMYYGAAPVPYVYYTYIRNTVGRSITNSEMTAEVIYLPRSTVLAMK